jgi:hypothetical protein
MTWCFFTRPRYIRLPSKSVYDQTSTSQGSHLHWLRAFLLYLPTITKQITEFRPEWWLTYCCNLNVSVTTSGVNRILLVVGLTASVGRLSSSSHPSVTPLGIMNTFFSQCWLFKITLLGYEIDFLENQQFEKEAFVVAETFRLLQYVSENSVFSFFRTSLVTDGKSNRIAITCDSFLIG